MGWLNMDLTFQGVEKEFSEIPAMVGPPSGAFLLAFADGELAGGVGLRKPEAGVCKMKRLSGSHRTFHGTEITGRYPPPSGR
jgi:putative acetyltransferase